MTKINDTEELYAAWLTGYMDGKTNELPNPPQEDDAGKVYGLAYKLGAKKRLKKQHIKRSITSE